MTPATESGSALAVWRIPAFRRYLTARFATTFGFQMQQLLVSWVVYDITRDPLTLGLIGLMEFIPAALVLMPAGHLVDRIVRKRVVLAAASALLLTTLALLLIGTQHTALYASRNVWPYYAVILFTGLARGVIGPAFFGWMGELVPKALYARSSAWMSTVWQTAAVAGPATGGLLLAWLGMQPTLLIVLGCLLTAVVLFSTVPSQTREALPASEG